MILSALVTAGLVLAVTYHFQHRVASIVPIPTIGKGETLQPIYFAPIADTAPGVQHFADNKSRFALPFTTSGTLTTWTFACQCTNNFNVEVHDSKGNLVDIPLNSIGNTRLAAMAGYPAGNYTFDVAADGKWIINLINESMLPLVNTPFHYFSSGTSILGPFSSNHNQISVGYIANLGQLLSVQVLDKNNVGYGYPIFTIRSLGESLTLPNPPNPYYLSVNGAGLWLLDIK